MDFTSRILAHTPPAYRQRLVDIKNKIISGYRHYYYSQFGEDIVVTTLLPQKNGFYVDIGAHHPKRYSNTKLLYERGWHGINVDPNEETMRQFNQARRRDINIVCGVGGTEGVAPYYRFSDGAYNTFSSTQAQALKAKRWLTPLPTKNVPLFTLKNLLDKHLPRGVQIDFLNVDTEENDLAVLQSNDFAQYAPRVIAVEDHRFNPEEPLTSEIFAYLKGQGYQLTAYVPPTIFVKKI
jgi:FkbM family methyltransferase